MLILLRSPVWSYVVILSLPRIGENSFIWRSYLSFCAIRFFMEVHGRRILHADCIVRYLGVKRFTPCATLRLPLAEGGQNSFTNQSRLLNFLPFVPNKRSRNGSLTVCMALCNLPWRASARSQIRMIKAVWRCH